MLVFGSFRFDVANATLCHDEQSIPLTPKAFNALRYLVEHAGQLVSKDQLWRAVWPGISVTDAALTMCVSEIRKALRDDPRTPRYIETVHRLGYRFIAPVSDERAENSSSDLSVNKERTPAIPAFSTAHFVGRAIELEQLHGCLGRALKGERQIVFITGEPGIGKTTLVEQFLREAQLSANGELWLGLGQCIEHYGTGEAYLPLLDALARLCRDERGVRLVELLDKHAPTWLAQMPSLLDTARSKEMQGRIAGAGYERMLRELAVAIEAISQERPLVLRLEDLHWSDYSTLEWLGFMARRPEAARLLVIISYRPVEVIVQGHPLKNLKQELLIHGLCRELPLSLLSEKAVTEYLTLRLASGNSFNANKSDSITLEQIEKIAHAVYQRTDGNPLFMVNVVDQLEQGLLKSLGELCAGQESEAFEPNVIELPPTIVQMIEQNIERLNADERAVLEAASVAGSEFSAASAAAALKRASIEIETACDRLARQQQFIQSLGTAQWPDGTVGAPSGSCTGSIAMFCMKAFPPAAGPSFIVNSPNAKSRLMAPM